MSRFCPKPIMLLFIITYFIPGNPDRQVSGMRVSVSFDVTVHSPDCDHFDALKTMLLINLLFPR